MPEKELLKTPKFLVEQWIETGRDGAARHRYVVVHPGAVVILPVLPGNEIVMIRQHRSAVRTTLWELPAGTREQGEEPIETAARELLEETGYRAGRLDALGSFYTSPGILDEMMHSFVATDLVFEGQQLGAGEQIETHCVALDEARRMLSAGAILDGKTIATLGLYFLPSGKSAERNG